MWRFALPVVVLLGLGLPARALACSCAWDEEIFPKEGLVPANVTFYAARLSQQRLVLIDGKGGRVPLEHKEVGDRVTLLRPSAPLEEGQRYRMEMDREPGGSSRPPLGTYEIRGGLDVTPPNPPTWSRADYEHSITHMGSSCQTELEGYTLQTEGAQDDRATGAQLALVVVSASAPDQVLALLSPGRDFIGQSVCLYNFDVDKARGTQVALRSVDLAGNLSAPGPILKLSKGMPILAAFFLLTTLGRGLLVAVVVSLIGLVLLMTRRSPRETRPL